MWHENVSSPSIRVAAQLMLEFRVVIGEQSAAFSLFVSLLGCFTPSPSHLPSPSWPLHGLPPRGNYTETFDTCAGIIHTNSATVFLYSMLEGGVKWRGTVWESLPFFLSFYKAELYLDNCPVKQVSEDGTNCFGSHNRVLLPLSFSCCHSVFMRLTCVGLMLGQYCRQCVILENKPSTTERDHSAIVVAAQFVVYP